MQFSATWRDVLAGRKTMTRRGASPGDAAARLAAGRPVPIPLDPGASPDAVLRGGRLHWVVGRTYAVQPGRGKPAVGRILLTGIRYCERAGDISEGDARAEGFESATQFREVYARLNGASSLDRPCWALTFHLIEDEA